MPAVAQTFTIAVVMMTAMALIVGFAGDLALNP